MPTPDSAQIRPLAKAGYELIPLHRWDHADEHRGKRRERGKTPVHPNWTRRPYKNADQVAHMEKGGNVGVRLRATDLVVDVDPRADDGRWGVPAFNELCLRLGLVPDWPRVETGGGGSHLYLKKPDDVSVVDGLPDFPGVEFKTLGRQVVAAGSVHPSGRRYEWDPFNDDPSEAPACPEALLDAIRRSSAGSSGAEAGVHTAEELASMLEALDPEEFRVEDEWRSLMMACPHATAGAGREEFAEWSARDPLYADDGPEVRLRWDSLDAGREGAVTYRTLHKLMRDAGAEAAIPRPSAEDDFPDDLPDKDGGASGGNPVDALIGEMNETFCAVLDGGAFQVFMQDHDAAFGRNVWTRMSRDAFRHYFEDERVTPFGSQKAVSKADLWLASPRRRKYSGIVMDPEGLPENEGKLNLWQGWSVEPRPGDWSMMEELIGEVLCDGDADAERYVRRWIAYMLQRPWETPEAAIAFRGDEGTGKGTLGRALMRIAGPHGLTVSSRAQFTGRFNSHLRDCVFLFADEAFWPGDKEGEGVLKQLVTEPVIAYEAKGKDLVSGRNMVHLMLASNEEWIVPAGREARRFFVADVSNRRREDHAFFAKLWRQMEDGGLAAMAHDLATMDLGGWRPAMSIPQTQALADQKVLSLDPVSKFWLELLNLGDLPFVQDIEGEVVEWSEGPVELGADERARLVAAYDAFLKRNRIMSAKATHKAVVNSGKRFGLQTSRGSGGSERVWHLPALGEMRARFEQSVGARNLFDD